MNRFFLVLLLTIAFFSCYPNWTQIHYETDRMTGQQSVRSGVMAYSGMQQGLGAKIFRVEGVQGTAFQVMGQTGSGWCDDETLEMRIDGAYYVLQTAEPVTDGYRFGCVGYNCYRTTARVFIIPDSVPIDSDSSVHIQWCGLYREVREGSVSRLAQVHNERFDD